MTTKRKPTEREDLVGLILTLREMGVVHYEANGVKLVLGPPPTNSPTVRDDRKPPEDALDVALKLRGTRPEDSKHEAKEK